MSDEDFEEGLDQGREEVRSTVIEALADGLNAEQLSELESQIAAIRIRWYEQRKSKR